MPSTPDTDRYVGRADVLATLDEAVRAVRAGEARTLLITGEPGIGKTRTLEELARCATGLEMQLLLGRCRPTEGAPAYWPWAQILRDFSEEPTTLALLTDLGPALGVLADAFPELRERLPNLGTPSDLGDDAASRFRLFQAVATALRRSARRAPLLLVLEDLHWADEASLRLLTFFRQEIAGAPVLVAASYRDVEVDDAHPLARHLSELSRDATFISLDGLGAGEVAELMSASGARPSDRLVRRVHTRTGGNPLFVLETKRAITPGAGRDGELEVGDAALPEGIRQALRGRLGRLSPGCLRVLEIASAIGDDFDLDLLGRASESASDPMAHDEVLAALAEGVAARLVARSPGSEFRYSFAHALVRELLYEELGPKRQVGLHAAIGSALERLASVDERLAELAHHYCRAAPAGYSEEAITYATRAGDEATGRWAHEEAAALYGRALDVLCFQPQADPGRHCDLLIALGQAQTLAGSRESAIQTLARAAALAREWDFGERLARAVLSTPVSHTGNTMSAAMGDDIHREALEEALAALPDEDGSLRVRLLARLSALQEDRAPLSHQAVEMARRLGEPDALVTALEAQHFALWEPHHADERLALALEMDRLAPRTGSVYTAYRACHAAIGDLLELGDRRGLQRSLERMEHVAAELRQPSFGVPTLHARAGQAFLDGDLAGFDRIAQEALALAHRFESPDALAVYGGQLAVLRREQDRLDEVLPPVRGMIAQFPEVPSWRAALAWIHSEAGRDDEARAEIEPILERGLDQLPKDGFWQLSVHMLSEIIARLGERGHLTELYRILLPCSGHAIVVGPVLCFGAADRSLAQLAAALGNDEDAHWHFDQALAVDAAMEAVPCLAHSRIEYARYLIDKGETSADQRRARELLDLAQEAAARHELPLVQRRVAALRTFLPDEGRTFAATAHGGAQNVFVCEGDTWLVRFGGQEVRVRATKGIEYLSQLMADPGQDLLAVDLMGLASKADGAGPVDAERGAPGVEILDAQARQDYRRRLEELREQGVEAEAASDAGRLRAIQDEMGFLEQGLSSATGLGGRQRHAPDAAEKARKAVYNRIRSSIARLLEVHPPLGRHLERAIRTGTLCSYHPEVPVEWELGAPR